MDMEVISVLRVQDKHNEVHLKIHIDLLMGVILIFAHSCSALIDNGVEICFIPKGLVTRDNFVKTKLPARFMEAYQKRLEGVKKRL